MSGGGRGTDQSIGKLVSNVTTNVSSLVRLELELAKTELSESGEAGRRRLRAVPRRGRAGVRSPCCWRRSPRPTGSPGSCRSGRRSWSWPGSTW